MKTKKNTLLLGAHISIAGGFDQAIYRGESIGCTAIQIFTKSNRQWHAKPLKAKEIEQFKRAVQKSSIQSIIAHAAYLINIGSPDKHMNQKSVKSAIEELERCEQLGIPYLVLHPGSHIQSSEQECLDQIADNLNEIFSKVPGHAGILLEIMAGQGSSVCYNFEQIAYVYHASSYKKRLGVCFDTCHAFAAGYDFRTKLTYDHMWKTFDSILGFSLLKAMHVNDSKKECGSHVDRHEEIGQGKLGLSAFKLLFNDKRFFNIPKILETPKDDLEHYLKNMRIIKRLISPENKKQLYIAVK